MKTASILSKIASYDKRPKWIILAKRRVKVRQGNHLVKGYDLDYHDTKILHFYYIGETKRFFIENKTGKTKPASDLTRMKKCYNVVASFPKKPLQPIKRYQQGNEPINI